MDSIESSSVTIIIKAPNQQIDDQTIQCCINWSIKRLKDYLSEVYPSKPKSEDQKLIYSGKLLTDSSILKDILRTYEGQENHTVHLVCRNMLLKDKSVPQNCSSTTPDATTSSSENTQRPDEEERTANSPFQTFVSNNANNDLPHFMNPNMQAYWNQVPSHFANIDPRFIWPSAVPNVNNARDTQQQYALMQQMYAQYISQYMQMMGRIGSARNISFQFQSPPNVNPSGIQLEQQPVMAENAPLPQNNRVEPVRRNPRAEFGDGDENGDWLDFISTFARILLFLSFVYFYSSPMRFFFVIALTFIMYMYQFGYLGQLGNRQLILNNNNNNNVNFNNNNNNANHNRLNDNAGNTDNFNNQEGSADETTSDSSDSSNNAPDNRESQETVEREPDMSPFGIAWMIIRSFFLSLIPDQPNVI